jgi:hypothetical protein
VADATFAVAQALIEEISLSGDEVKKLFGNFCSSCGPKVSMVEDALKVNPEFSISELLDYLATKGRPPRKEHLPAMIRYLKVTAGES